MSMLKFEQICELVKLVADNGVAKVEIEQGGSRLLIEGPVPQPVAMPTAEAVMVAAPAAAPVAAGVEAAEPSVDSAEEGLEMVASPIVGTFYRAPNPDADPYVKVGDRVEPGQVLCIVEAMKLMNEIQSELSGTIVKVYPDNAEPVEFGQTLFAIQPD